MFLFISNSLIIKRNITATKPQQSYNKNYIVGNIKQASVVVLRDG